MAAKIILVTGGARSGKSFFAEEYAKKIGEKIAYIATAQIYDEEMKLRVEVHKNRRPLNWQTYESPFHAEASVQNASEAHDVILFDCVTLYLSNLLLSSDTRLNSAEKYNDIAKEFEKILETAKKNNTDIILVTNEVGMGIVPENALAREYRDFAGKINQLIAARADEVYWVISGIAVDIKKLAAEQGENNG